MAAGLTQTPGYPVSKRMSPRYEGTFAYVTVKDRMPRILTQVIDTIHREQEKLKELHGEAGTEDVKSAIGQLSELRYEMQTSKPMVPIKVGVDVKEWAMVFDAYRSQLQGEEPQWFSVSWLFAECYMYRKIAEVLHTSTFLKDFDPFAAQKEASFRSSLPQITALIGYLSRLIGQSKHSPSELRVEFEHLLLLCLWGNKMDLSMMASVDDYDGGQEHLSSLDAGPHAQELRTNILADHSTALWELLQLVSTPKEGYRRIDFVLDNAGFEIVSDLCLAEWLLSEGFADKVQFHLKQLPWFVSDALIKDFDWTLESLASHDDTAMAELGRKWKVRVKEGSMAVTDHPFWTTSFEYAAMKTVAPELYKQLSQAFLVFFKGDLNYRKLLADRNWLYTETFSMALGGFEPTNVCALRTLKADLVTGLAPGVAERAASENKDWMITGQYAVLQVHNKK